MTTKKIKNQNVREVIDERVPFDDIKLGMLILVELGERSSTWGLVPPCPKKYRR